MFEVIIIIIVISTIIIIVIIIISSRVEFVQIPSKKCLMIIEIKLWKRMILNDGEMP